MSPGAEDPRVAPRKRFASSPADTSVVVARCRSRMKMPRAGLHLSDDRFHAFDVNATSRPLLEIDGCSDAPSAAGPFPPPARDTSAACPSRQANTDALEPP